MSGEIITNGVNNFTQIIDKLWTIAGEIMPYMLYIALTCLWITLAYNAVKYIIWYTENKTKIEWMKERRRRRRRNRRFTRSVKNHTYTFNW